MKVGGEFEFVDRSIPIKIGKGMKGHEKALAERMVLSVRNNCPSCKESLVPGKWAAEHRFELPQGLWIQISWDPNVVEVLTKPASLDEIRDSADDLQKLIWESAAKTGLTPDPEYRAGHFNFGVRDAFGENTGEFLKFFIDFANRPELAIGIFRKSNPLNSPHLAQLSSYQRSALSEIARKFHKQDPLLQRMDLAEMARLLVKRVLYKSATPSQTSDAAYYYQALGLKNILDLSAEADAPLEIRSMRSQRDIYDFLLISEIIEARLEYLKKLPPEVAFLVSQTAKTQFTEKELVSRFYIYLQEAGLSWDRYKMILPESMGQHKPHALLLTKNLSQRSFSSVAEFLPLLDLAPTSPWLQTRLAQILGHPATPESARALIDAELKNLAQKPEFSYEMKQAFIKLQLSLVPGSCRAIFL